MSVHRPSKQIDGKIFGVGINDSGLSASAAFHSIKPFQVWYGMMQRCYSDAWQKKYPTYIGCSVSQEWHRYSDFLQWYSAQTIGTGYQLDKDLLRFGNKIYGPSLCVMVPQHINKFVVDCAACRGDLPLGVTRSGSKFKSQVHIDHKLVYLGQFSTPEAAQQAYMNAKRGVVVSMKPELDAIHPDLYQALIDRYTLPVIELEMAA